LNSTTTLIVDNIQLPLSISNMLQITDLSLK